MKAQRLVIALVVVNLVLVFIVLTGDEPASSSPTPSVVRAKAFELVGGQGRTRARLNVEQGQAVFRMLDERGTIRVKLGADEAGSALLLLNERTEPGVHVLATRDRGTSLTLRNGGRERVIRP